MGKLSWLILVVTLAILLMAGIGMKQLLTHPQPVLLKELAVSSDNITIDQAIAIIGEARDSHILFKAALEIGMAQATEWTGNIADQNRIIARYSKVLNLLEALRTPPVKEAPCSCCRRLFESKTL